MTKAKKYFPLALVVSLGILSLDTLTPLGYASWVLYVFPLLIVYRTENAKLAYIVLGLDAFFTAVDLYLSPPGDAFHISVVNRIFGFLSLGVFTLLINDLIKKQKILNNRTLELADANRELEAFAYSASHDLQAPLRTISGFGRFLFEDNNNSLDDRSLDYIRRIVAGTERMKLLIDDLLNLSRIKRLEMNIDNVDLGEMAKEIFGELQASDPKRNVVFHVNGDLAAHVDRGLLRLALANLIGNAWKFTLKKEPAEIEFGVIKNQGKKVFFVRDNGAGFDAKSAANLFKPFHRLHSQSEFFGTGVGLTIVDRVITRHGGKVWTESKAGEGATFYFTLPH